MRFFAKTCLVLGLLVLAIGLVVPFAMLLAGPMFVVLMIPVVWYALFSRRAADD